MIIVWSFPYNSVVKFSILQRDYRKMIIAWSFSYNFVVKFHGKIFFSHNMTILYTNPAKPSCSVVRALDQGWKGC